MFLNKYFSIVFTIDQNKPKSHMNWQDAMTDLNSKALYSKIKESLHRICMHKLALVNLHKFCRQISYTKIWGGQMTSYHGVAICNRCDSCAWSLGGRGANKSFFPLGKWMPWDKLWLNDTYTSPFTLIFSG